MSIDMRPTVAITIRQFDWSGEAFALLSKNCTVQYQNTSGKRLTENDVLSAIAGVAGVIAGTEPFTARVLASTDSLRVISRIGVGIDSIDMEAAKREQIEICTTPFATVDAVAEHTIALLLAVVKNIPRYSCRTNETPLSGSRIAGKAVGIVGMGRVGQRVATILEGFGCQISFYDPFPTSALCDTWQRCQSIEALAQTSDIITLHCPPLSDGCALFTHDLFLKCQPGTFIVNTARGSLIDEDALVIALNNGIIAGAGLDVTQIEPYQGVLREYPQVCLTPHVASNTIESRREMEMEAVMNILRILGW